MAAEEKDPNTRPRKSYMTNSRSLADVMFMIAGSAICMAMLWGLTSIGLPERVGAAVATLATALVYACYINLLTIFRLPLSIAIAAGGISFSIFHWFGPSDLGQGLFQVIGAMIASAHVLQAWRK